MLYMMILIFRSLFTHIKSVTELSVGNDYSLFKEGIKPMWEDDKNKKGGRWLLNVDIRMKSNLHELWLNLVSSNFVISLVRLSL